MRKYLESPLFALAIIAFGFALHAIVQPSGSGFSPSEALSLFGTSPFDSLRRESARLERRIAMLSQMGQDLKAAIPATAVSRDMQQIGDQIDLIQERLDADTVATASVFEEMDEPALRAEVARQERFVAAYSQVIADHQEMVEAIPTLIPTIGVVSSGFGERVHPVTGVHRKHTGMDLAAPKGTAITAANGGTVVFAGIKGGYGNAVVIDHGYGYQTLYGHASELLVKKGDQIAKGDPIALVGSTGVSTGPHLHYEVIVDSAKINPHDFLRQPPVLVASATLQSLEQEHGHNPVAEQAALAAKKSAGRKALLAKKGSKSSRGTLALAGTGDKSRM